MESFVHQGQSYRLRVGMAALRRYSSATGRPLLQDLERLNAFQTDADAPQILCDVFWASLLPQPDRECVDEMIDDLGIQPALDLLGAAAAEAFPSSSPENP